MSKPTEENNRKMNKVWESFVKTAETVLAEKGLNKAGFFVFRPHNLFMGFDRSNIFFVLSFSNAVMGMKMVHQTDLTRYGNVTLDQVIQSCRNEIGFQSPVGLVFPKSLFDMNDPELSEAILPMVNEIITKAIKQSEGSKSRVF